MKICTQIILCPSIPLQKFFFFQAVHMILKCPSNNFFWMTPYNVCEVTASISYSFSPLCKVHTFKWRMQIFLSQIRVTTAFWVEIVWNRRIQFVNIRRHLFHERVSERASERKRATRRASRASSREQANERAVRADEKVAQCPKHRVYMISTQTALSFNSHLWRVRWWWTFCRFC